MEADLTLSSPQAPAACTVGVRPVSPGGLLATVGQGQGVGRHTFGVPPSRQDPPRPLLRNSSFSLPAPGFPRCGLAAQGSAFSGTGDRGPEASQFRFLSPLRALGVVGRSIFTSIACSYYSKRRDICF